MTLGVFAWLICRSGGFPLPRSFWACCSAPSAEEGSSQALLIGRANEFQRWRLFFCRGLYDHESSPAFVASSSGRRSSGACARREPRTCRKRLDIRTLACLRRLPRRGYGMLRRRGGSYTELWRENLSAGRGGGSLVLSSWPPALPARVPRPFGDGDHASSPRGRCSSPGRWRYGSRAPRSSAFS